MPACLEKSRRKMLGSRVGLRVESMEGSSAVSVPWAALPGTSWPQGWEPLCLPFFQCWQTREEREKQVWDGQGLGTDGKRCRLGLETEKTGRSMGTRSADEGEEQEGNEAKEIRVQGGKKSLWVRRGSSSGWKGLRGLDVADGLCFCLCLSLT